VRAEAIDETAAMRAKAEAERELLTRTGEMEIIEAQAKLLEAVAQLRAIEHLRRKTKRK
jgi:F-type H+-transporting ATPase subunit epsilon